MNVIREFAAVVAELIPDLRTDDLQAFPALQTEDALRDLIEHDSPVQLLCASAMALVRRPTEARGVLTELQVMAGRGEMSTPLAAIFDEIARAKPGMPAPVSRPLHGTANAPISPAPS